MLEVKKATISNMTKVTFSSAHEKAPSPGASFLHFLQNDLHDESSAVPVPHLKSAAHALHEH